MRRIHHVEAPVGVECNRLGPGVFAQQFERQYGKDHERHRFCAAAQRGVCPQHGDHRIEQARHAAITRDLRPPQQRQRAQRPGHQQRQRGGPSSIQIDAQYRDHRQCQQVGQQVGAREVDQTGAPQHPGPLRPAGGTPGQGGAATRIPGSHTAQGQQHTQAGPGQRVRLRQAGRGRLGHGCFRQTATACRYRAVCPPCGATIARCRPRR